MSVLVRQPHGFEGLFGALIHLELLDLSVPQGPDMGIHDGTPDLYAACLAATEIPDKHNYLVARIEKLLRLRSNLFQDRQKLLCHPVLYFGPPAIGSGLWEVGRY